MVCGVVMLLLLLSMVAVATSMVTMLYYGQGRPQPRLCLYVVESNRNSNAATCTLFRLIRTLLRIYNSGSHSQILALFSSRISSQRYAIFLTSIHEED
jgi:hypothetical protein